MCTYELYFKYKGGVIVVQNRHRTSAYFGSAVQVQRKYILSAALLMCSPPTWGAYTEVGSNIMWGLDRVGLSVSESQQGRALYAMASNSN